MDQITNPFAPGAGTRPPALVGRDDIVEQATISIQRLKSFRPERSQILVGLRGVGKTVLLNEILAIAEEQNLITELIEAPEKKTLAELLAPFFRKCLFKLSRVEQAKGIARRGLGVLKSFFDSVKLTFNDLEVGLSIDPEPGTADSGDLEADLPELFVALGKAAKAANRPIVLLIDELQYISSEEFSALIMSVHKVNQQNLPILLFGAGLPQILGLAGNSKSYAERLFRFPEIGPLPEGSVEDALRQPAKTEGADFSADAILKLSEITQRYPYFVQQWAFEAWNDAEGPIIQIDDIVNSSQKAISELDQSFFKVRFDRCTPSEKKYMRALADFGKGEHRSGDVADLLGVKIQSVAPTRSALIKKGMIYAPNHGGTAFTVPMFEDYMKRVMPTLVQK